MVEGVKRLLIATIALAGVLPTALLAEPGPRLEGTLFLYPDVSYETRSGGKLVDLPDQADPDRGRRWRL